MTKIKSYRIRVTAGGKGHESKTYLTRDEKGRVSYFSGAQTPLALANLVHSAAAELTFALEDARDGAAACKTVTDVLKQMWAGNPGLTPKVELLA